MLAYNIPTYVFLRTGIKLFEGFILFFYVRTSFAKINFTIQGGSVASNDLHFLRVVNPPIIYVSALYYFYALRTPKSSFTRETRDYIIIHFIHLHEFRLRVRKTTGLYL